MEDASNGWDLLFKIQNISFLNKFLLPCDNPNKIQNLSSIYELPNGNLFII
jgi:hypothetical protein